MKIIVFSTRKNEKEIFMKANASRHEFTWQTVSLNVKTAPYAAGHQVALVFTHDDVSGPVIEKLAQLGVKYIITRSAGTDHIDFDAAKKKSIKIENIPDYLPYGIAEHAVALTLALCRHLIEANRRCRAYDFTLDHLTGFNLHGKTVGIIGMGRIGKATGKIFQGFGCYVIGYDADLESPDEEIKKVELDELLKTSDIISLHLPLREHTMHLINAKTIDQMKMGAMLINTARGGLVNTEELLTALDAGKLGYYGADVYEFEKGIFFEDHRSDGVRDALLTKLMEHPNVLMTPHQAFLTVEALSDIARKTIQSLDLWESKAELCS